MQSVLSLIKTKTLRQSLVTFGGSLINGALGAVFFILVARSLGPAAFGIFSLSVAVSTLVGDIADFGTNTGIVRFVGKYARRDPSCALQFLKLGLGIKLVIGLGIAILGYFLAPFVAGEIFQKADLTTLLRIVFMGVLGILLFTFTTAGLQAYQKFWQWSGLFIFTNLLRLAVTLALIAINAANTTSVLITYISLPFLGFLVGSFFLPLKSSLSQPVKIHVLSDFLGYNKWVAVSTLIAAISARLDVFISARLISETELGIYSASNQLVQVVPQLVGALGTVIAPKMAEMSAESFPKYFKKTQILVLIIAFLGLLGIPVAQLAIPLLYGSEYAGSISIFAVLLVAMLVFLISLPVHMAVYYYYGFPKLFFYIGLGHLMINLFLGWFMIERFGGMGAALTVFTGTLFGFLVPAFWVLGRMAKKK